MSATDVGEDRHLLDPEPVPLRDGRVICIRRIDPDDWERLQVFHRRLSEHTLRMRFFTPLRQLDTKFAQHLCNVDFEKRAAFVASFPGDLEIRAVGRYEMVAPAIAEVAFVVEDRMQGTGIGAELIRHVAANARRHGITEFTAVVLAENREMVRLLMNSGFPYEVTLEGETENVRLQIGAAPGA